MKIIFNWCDSFDENTTWTKGEEMLSLEILQKEGCFASAKIRMQNKPILHRYARIGIEENGEITTLFRGKVISFPVGFNSSVMTIELLSEPSDYQQQLQNFSKENWHKYKEIDFSKNSEDILFDDLLFPNNSHDNPTIFLEGDNKIFYWNKSDGKLSFSDIISDGHNFKISKKDIIDNTTRVRLAREPYGRVNIRLSTSWIQKVYGFVDLMPLIASRFQYNRINSFTDIFAGFRNVFRDGYSLVYRKINRANPNEYGILNRFPMCSDSVKINNESDEESAQPKVVHFRRFYYEGNFILNWEYHQKRQEILEVSLIDSKHTRTKNISLELNPIQLSKDFPYWVACKNYSINDVVMYAGHIYECQKSHRADCDFHHENWKHIGVVPDALGDDTLSSFFATDRGKFCIRYALRKAAALINCSQRCMSVIFCVDGNKFWPITVNDQIEFCDLNMHGKVVQTKLIFNENKRVMWITASCSPENYSDVWEKIRSYQFEIDQDSHQLNIGDIITGIAIENPPEDQEKMLTSADFSSEAQAKRALMAHATKIHVGLHPLSVKRNISRTIKLPDLQI